MTSTVAADRVTEEPPGAGRSAVVDLVRSLALARVVVWHLLAVEWLTWIAAMPIMFFAAGMFLARSSAEGRVSFLRRRLRRLLIPMWGYAIGVAATMIYVPLGDERWTGPGNIATGALTWVFPMVDPVSSAWHGGWLSSHLWYLRAYVWLLVLAPLVLVVARRLVLGAVGVAAAAAYLEAAARLRWPVLGDGSLRVLLGDIVVYGFFTAAGVAYAQRRHAPSAPWAAVVAVVLFAGAAAFAVLVPLPPGGVNSSYAATFLTGLAWLALVAAARRPLEAVARKRVVERVAHAVSRRALTVYLWHPIAIVLSYALVPQGHRWYYPALAGSTVALTAITVVAVGWLEDVARDEPRRRRLHLPALRTAAAIPVTVVALAVAMPSLVGADAAGSSGRRAPNPPSFREPLSNTAFARRAVGADAPFRLRNGVVPAKQLQETVRRWTAAQPGVASVAVGLVVDGKLWSGDAAGPAPGHRARADERIPVMSLTKSFTGALVLREAEAGRVSLDDPMPRLPGIARPRGPAAAITPRHLLNHRSGLVDYPTTERYDADRPITPERAVTLSLTTPLLGAPGTQAHYANSNFLYLGVLLEQVTGRSYAELVAELAARHSLHATGVEPGSPGWVGHASGGIHSTVGDLARWGATLFTPGAVLSPTTVSLLTTLGDDNLGLSTWPMCPCGTDAAGRRVAAGYGQHVGFGGLYHYPSQMSLVVRVEPSSAEAGALYESLAEEIRATIRAALR